MTDQSGRLRISNLIRLIFSLIFWRINLLAFSVSLSMDLITNPLPPQFVRRAATARFIVDLELYFSKHDLASEVRGHGPKFAGLPAPPDHLSREAVEECWAIASMLTLARTNKCEPSYGNIEHADY